MNLNSVHISGPLSDDSLYIERQADLEILHRIQAMDYVTIIVPRRQGKSSLVRHLMCNSSLSKTVVFVYINVSLLDNQQEIEWYDTLCAKYIVPRLGEIIPTAETAIPHNSFEWRDFLFEISSKAGQIGKKIVIVLDEVEKALIDHYGSFFKILREICNTSRVEMNSEFKNLAFILIGTFNTCNLIKDRSGLTFNIGYQIKILDFTLENIEELLYRRGWEKSTQVKRLAARIYYWTSGHPYLTQLICTYLSEKSTIKDVDAASKNLLSEDIDDLRDLINELETDNVMKNYARRILEGETIPFSPVIEPLHRQLFYSGWIKADKKGLCSIRNRIYQTAFRTFLDLSTVPNTNHGKEENMIPSEQLIAMQILKEAFSFVADELKQRWKAKQIKSQNQKEGLSHVESISGISQELQSKLVKQLEKMQNEVDLEMLTNNLKTEISMAKKYNQKWNRYREALPSASATERVSIEMQMEDAESNRDKAVREIKTILEKISKEEITTF